MHNKIWQKKIAVFLVIAMVLSFMPLAWANTGDTMTGGGSTTVSSPSALQWSDDTVAVMDSTTYSSLQLAINAIPANGSGTIKIVKDIEINQVINIYNGRDVTLLSEGAHTITFDVDYTGIAEGEQKCFNVGSTASAGGSSLTIGALDDTENVLTITSKKACKSIVSVWSTDTTAAENRSRFVLNSGTLKMAAGATATAIVGMSQAIFEMHGGVLENHADGRGLYVAWSSNAVMDGGTITNCVTTEGGGGVLLTGNSTFEMNDGAITDCQAKTGSAVYVNNDCTFTMNGGVIADNIAQDAGKSVWGDTNAVIHHNGGTIRESDTVAVLTTGDKGVGYASFTKAVEAIPADSEATITIVQNIMVDRVINIDHGRDVTLLSEGAHTITFDVDYTNIAEGDQKCFNVGSWQNAGGSSLTIGALDDTENVLTIKNKKSCNSGVVSVWSTADTAAENRSRFVLNSGTLEMGAGATAKVIVGLSYADFEIHGGTIQNNKNEIDDQNGFRGGVGVVNTTAEITGGTIQNCSAVNGGGLYVGGASSVAISGSASIKDCAAYQGGGIYVAQDSDCQITMDGGVIEDCTAQQDGGGVYYAANNTFTMNNGTISGNEASRGGGIYVAKQGELAMNEGKIEKNTATYQGGGVYVEANKFSMHDGAIAENKSGSGGGAGICLGEGTTFSMDGGEIFNNTAHGCGAGIYMDSKANAEISAGAITGNKSECNVGFGGGIYIHKEAELQLYNAVIKENTASALGGGLWTCNTGDIKIYITDGGAVYDNNAAAADGKSSEQAGDDISHFNYLPSDPLGSLTEGMNGHLTLYKRMLGGGLNQYYKDGGVTLYLGNPAPDKGEDRGAGTGAPDPKAKRYSETYQDPYTDTIDKNERVTLKNVVSAEAKEAAMTQAKVIISGNSASRGGGIGTNGNLIIGTPENQLYTVSIQKEWSDTTPADKKTEVTVWLLVNDQEIGSAKLNASNGWKADFTGLTDDPKDVTYSVKEDDMSGFTAKVGEPKRESNKISFAITNTWATGDLTVSKTVSGSGADKSKAFTFTVILSDKAINKTYGDMTFENGVANFTLKHGESKTAAGLPAGVNYTVTESNNSGYTVTMNVDGTVKEEAEGTIPANAASEVLFNNDKGSSGGGGGSSDNTSLTVRKVWVTDDGGTAADSVKVQLLQNGSVYDTVTLNARNNWSYTWYNLGDSDTWTVKEAAVPAGFISTVSGSGTVWTITNDDVPTDTPEEPTTPEEPDMPDEPTVPSEPGTPEEPNLPSEPGNPDDPEYGLDDPDVPKGGAEAPEDGTTSDGAPKTGDTAPTAVFAVLLLAAAGGFAITRRKRN